MSHEIRYYNAGVVNGENFPLAAEISDLRAQAIIEEPEQWNMSIVRWDLDSSLIPPAAVPMTTGAPGPFTPWPTLATVTLTRGVDVFGPIAVQNNGSGYIYSYSTFITAINTALATAYAGIAAPSSSAAPAFNFDPVTGLISLYFQETYNTGVPPIQIWVNSILYKYILNIPAALFTGLGNGQDFRITTADISATLIPAVGSRVGYPVNVQTMAGNVYKLTQQARALSQWTACRGLYVTTSSIPIYNENNPSSIFAGTQSQNTGQSSAAIVTDFSLTQAEPLDVGSRISYLPTAEYRMITLRGREPLYRIQLKAFWVDYAGVSHPVFIPPGGYFNLKILFRRLRASA